MDPHEYWKFGCIGRRINVQEQTVFARTTKRVTASLRTACCIIRVGTLWTLCRPIGRVKDSRPIDRRNLWLVESQVANRWSCVANSALSVSVFLETEVLYNQPFPDIKITCEIRVAPVNAISQVNFMT
jgi:hypothetical protein